MACSEKALCMPLQFLLQQEFSSSGLQRKKVQAQLKEQHLQVRLLKSESQLFRTEESLDE